MVEAVTSAARTALGPDRDRAARPAAITRRVTAALRRHRADLALTATGPVADEWLDVAQAFAGPPGDGREPAASGVPS